MSAGLDLTGLVLPGTVEEQSRSDDGRRAEYVLQPLERGFGHTVGNSIRRVLLSSLPGCAIWAFRADGVQHEHQTIPGVVEDIHQVIQKLKQLVVVLDPGVDEATLELSVSKAGPVTAAMIGSVSGVTVVNDHETLFTLQDDLPDGRPLNLDFWVNRGRGFVVAEQHERPEDAPVDLIRIDSVYNPVIRANFLVQETRVGQRTDFDRLTVQVETNGSVNPGDAIADAAEIARLHLQYLTGFGSGNGTSAPENGGQAGRGAVDAGMTALLESSLEAFDGISIRSRNNLDKADIHTLLDIVVRSRDDILAVPSFGEKSLEEIAEVLALNGLRFGMAIERDDVGDLWLVEEAEDSAAGGEGGDEA
ncbi:MAG: DNA-directed RNA polymerase subunit alpha [Gemmatimonadetes bacterium]|nr:DNA-directed RNA polymerase subunit alpha [Gemmatimonadota bacterium]NNK47963.1 DNA-directed RNA polymerase subunit alpha [Gemmatimonadota bacterium]